MDSAPCQQWVTGVDLAAISKTLAGVGHLRSICKGTWHVVWQAHYRRDFSQTWSAVREQISWEVFCILAHQIIRFVNMISRDRCSTLHDLASLFRGNSTLERWEGKIAKHIDRRPSAAHSSFHFWRMYHSIASFFVLSSWKIEDASQNFVLLELWTFIFQDVSQNCFVGFVHIHFLRKSEISQNCQLSDRCVDRWMD